METKCFIVASSSDRLDALDRCIRCINNNPLYRTTDIFLYYQGANINEIPHKERFRRILYDPNLRGIFTPRYELFKITQGYDYVILIDDDLYMYEDTSYESCIAFLKYNPLAGCINIGTQKKRRKNAFVCISDSMGYYNVEGGLVLPQKSVKIILDYFQDKEADYTEDMFWLLLYVKGLDLWQDRSSNANHVMNVKTKSKEITGYTKMRYEKPYKPILSEWFRDTEITTEGGRFKPVRGIKSLRHITALGLEERRRNYGKTKNRD